jgi:hypothetical protein
MARQKKTLADLQDVLQTWPAAGEPAPEGDVFLPEGEGEGEGDETEGHFDLLPRRNVKTYDDMIGRVDELATLDANGADALPNLALEIAAWAGLGIINAKAPSKKDPDATDQVREVYLRYAETKRDRGANKNVVASKRSTDAQVSKLRIFAKIGERQDIDAGDFLFSVTQVRNELDAAGLATKGPYIAMQDAARAVAGKRELTSDEMRTAILKKPAAARTALSVWKAIQNNVKALIEDELENTAETQQLRDMVAEKVAFHDQLAKFVALGGLADRFGFKIVRINPDDQPNSADEASE